MTSPIAEKQAQLAQSGFPLGSPTGEESRCQDGSGLFRHFQGGSIYWSPTTGAHLVYGLIRDKWARLGWEQSPLGYPTTDEGDALGGRYSDFQGGSIMWKGGAPEAFAVYGAIAARWFGQGKWSGQAWDTGPLGFPLIDESGCPDGIGRFNHFENGSIYFSPTTGAKIIYGLIRDKWARLGWEQSPLGYPTTDEGDALGGRYSDFQGGSILWRSGEPEAFAVCGHIASKWFSQGKWQAEAWDTGPLGFPVMDEGGTPDGIGRFNHFQNGSIYWTPETGARIVKGPIRDAWAAQGWEVSRLQYPAADETIDGENHLQRFEGGEILWSPSQGSRINYFPNITHVAHADRDLHAGDVYAKNIWVQFWNDGRWQFQASMESDASVIGDKYAVGFVLKGDGHAGRVAGGLGVGESETAAVGGTDPWIEQYFHRLKTLPVSFTLHQSSDVSGALGAVWNTCKEYAPGVIALAGSL